MHPVTHGGNPEVSFHIIIRLWLANKKTTSNQRRANGATAASRHTENRLRIFGASNAGFFYIIWGLALRVLDGVQAEITTLKRRMDNKDPENEDQRSKTHPARTPNVIEWWKVVCALATHFYYCFFSCFCFPGKNQLITFTCRRTDNFSRFCSKTCRSVSLCPRHCKCMGFANFVFAKFRIVYLAKIRWYKYQH